MDDKEFLLTLKEYIEKWEYENEQEWGAGRELDAIILGGRMPVIYSEVLRRLRVITND